MNASENKEIFFNVMTSFGTDYDRVLLSQLLSRTLLHPLIRHDPVLFITMVYNPFFFIVKRENRKARPACVTEVNHYYNQHTGDYQQMDIVFSEPDINREIVRFIENDKLLNQKILWPYLHDVLPVGNYTLSMVFKPNTSMTQSITQLKKNRKYHLAYFSPIEREILEENYNFLSMVVFPAKVKLRKSDYRFIAELLDSQSRKFSPYEKDEHYYYVDLKEKMKFFKSLYLPEQGPASVLTGTGTSVRSSYKSHLIYLYRECMLFLGESFSLEKLEEGHYFSTE